ncbi:FCD domain-containing protein [Paenibacillus medicaginis]|uniref:FCD domain-containing protein n=1 Tax=Paenibacillus medicaginis TaxID=1470560 RepID=A0ABV5BZG2_9BACL
MDMYEVRFILEVEISKLAAERRDDRDLEHIHECLMLRSITSLIYCEINVR